MKVIPWKGTQVAVSNQKSGAVYVFVLVPGSRYDDGKVHCVHAIW